MSDEIKVENAEEAAEVVEEAKECCCEAAEEVTEAAEEAKECCCEAAEEVTEAAEEAKECCCESAEEVTEAAEEAKEEVKAELEEFPVKSPAPKKNVVIKKRKGMSSTTLITIIVCAVVVLACLAFIGAKLGWFHIPSKAKFTVDDYSKIEVYTDDVSVSDEDTESALNSMKTYYTTTEDSTEGVVEDGDTVKITYAGTLDETGEAFEGGTTETAQSLTIGSGSFIDGFEDGLIGKKVGSDVDVKVTFPDVYENNPDLQGKPATFKVHIESKTLVHEPEIDDAFIAEKSLEYTESIFGEACQCDTVEAFKEFYNGKTYDNNVQQAMFKNLMSKIHVTSYDEKLFEGAKEEQLTMLNYYSQMYGIDADTYASYAGAANADEYATNEAQYGLQQAMLFGKLADDLGISHTDADTDEAIVEYMADYGYDESYTLEEFKETNGDFWYYKYKNYNSVVNEVLEKLKDNVEFIEGSAPVEETTAAAE